MDYKKIYDYIIENRIMNPITEKNIYTESHHIKPRCLFPKGTSNKYIRKKIR